MFGLYVYILSDIYCRICIYSVWYICVYGVWYICICSVCFTYILVVLLLVVFLMKYWYAIYLFTRAMITQLLKASVWVLQASFEECITLSLQEFISIFLFCGIYTENMSSPGILSTSHRNPWSNDVSLSACILLKLAKRNTFEFCFYWGSTMLRMDVTSEDTN